MHTEVSSQPKVTELKGRGIGWKLMYDSKSQLLTTMRHHHYAAPKILFAQSTVLNPEWLVRIFWKVEDIKKSCPKRRKLFHQNICNELFKSCHGFIFMLLSQTKRQIYCIQFLLLTSGHAVQVLQVWLDKNTNDGFIHHANHDLQTRRKRRTFID